MKTYRVGIIGFGFIGKVHAHGYLNLPFFYSPAPPATITHVCTGHQESAEAGAQLVGAAHAGTDYREITENPEIDIVHICSPNHRHLAALLSAMRHQKHIYCDKPITATLDEARQIEQALPAYHGIAQMTFQIRFFSALMRAKQLIEEGFLGDLLQFRCVFLHGGSADPNAPLKWKLSAAAGGGVIADLASHTLDIVHHLAGDYAAISATSKIAFPTRPSPQDPAVQLPVEAEDAVWITAKMKNGAVGTIEATKLATGSEDELRLELHGTKGALRFNGMEPHHLEAYDVTASASPMGGRRGWTHIDVGQRYPPPAGFPGPKFTIGWLRTHMACLYNFLAAVAENRPAQPDLRQGIYVQKLMDCTRRAVANGTWIDVDS